MKQITLLHNHAGDVDRARYIARELERARQGDLERCKYCGARFFAYARPGGIEHPQWSASACADGQRHTAGWIEHEVVKRLTFELIEAVKAL